MALLWNTRSLYYLNTILIDNFSEMVKGAHKSHRCPWWYSTICNTNILGAKQNHLSTGNINSVLQFTKISSVLVIHCYETKKKPYQFCLPIINSVKETPQLIAIRFCCSCWSIGIRKTCKFKKLQYLKRPLSFFPFLKISKFQKSLCYTHVGM